MFRIELDQFADAMGDAAQMAQDARVATARVKGVSNALATKAAGSWFKTATLSLSQVQGKLEIAEGILKGYASTFEAAHGTLEGTLLPQYQAVVKRGNGSAPPRVVSYDAGLVKGFYGAECSAYESVGRGISGVWTSMNGLNGAEGIATHLKNLERLLGMTHTTVTQTHDDLANYITSVNAFEDTYGAQFDPRRLYQKGIWAIVSDGLGTVKSALDILKHVGTIGGFWGTIIGSGLKSYAKYGEGLVKGGGLEQFKSFFTGKNNKSGYDFKSSFMKSFDFLNPSKWKEGFSELWTGKSAAAATAGKVAKLDGVSKGVTRLKAGAKVLGYAADVISVANIGFKGFKAGEKQKGDVYDKAAATNIEVAKGVTKFVAGKAVAAGGKALGAAIGTAICPGIGTAIGGFVGGFVAGVAFDAAWTAGDNLLKRSGVQDKLVKGLGSVYRAPSNLLKKGWKALTGG